jgi:uncharacterized protein (DUF488 family)
VILSTIGFSGKSAEEFFTILVKNRVRRLIDIRLNNKSQLAGFTSIKHLPYLLKLHNIMYHYKPEYAPTKELLDGYKNQKIKWEDYERIYNDLIRKRNLIKEIDWDFFENAVFLCSEPTAEKCHRRLLAEILAQKNSNIHVRHL